MVKMFFVLRLAALMTFCSLTLPSAFGQGGTPHFDDTHFVPQERGEPLRLEAPSKPIPRSWLISGAGVSLLLAGAVLYFAIKAWRSSNVFERKYHFPPAGQAALRFGGKRSGGFMAASESANEKRNA